MGDFINFIKRNILLGKLTIVVFFFLFFFLLFVFSIGKIYDAAHKPFWIDEKYGLEYSVGTASYSDLLIKGAQGQGSAAPLDYIICKVVDQMKDRLSSLAMPSEVYYRLFPIGITAVTPLIILIVLGAGIFKEKENPFVKPAQLFLFLYFCLVFLFSTQIHYYAAETRPYALWVSVFLLALVGFLIEDDKNLFLPIALLLLAFSATAGIFQLMGIAAAYVISSFIQKEKAKEILWKSLKLFALPFIVSIYYCLRPAEWNMVDAGGTWMNFFRFWLKTGALIIPLAFVLFFCCLVRKENTKYIVVPLAYLITFFLGPAIFWITRLKGFFYAQRQFLYYDLTLAIFVLTVIKCFPAMVKGNKTKFERLMIVAIVIFIGLMMVMSRKPLTRFLTAERNASVVISKVLNK